MSDSAPGSVLLISDSTWASVPRWLRLPLVGLALWPVSQLLGWLVPPPVVVYAVWLVLTYRGAVAIRRLWCPDLGRVGTGLLVVGLAPIVLTFMAIVGVTLVLVAR